MITVKGRWLVAWFLMLDWTTRCGTSCIRLSHTDIFHCAFDQPPNPYSLKAFIIPQQWVIAALLSSIWFTETLSYGCNPAFFFGAFFLRRLLSPPPLFFQLNLQSRSKKCTLYCQIGLWSFCHRTFCLIICNLIKCSSCNHSVLWLIYGFIAVKFKDLKAPTQGKSISIQILCLS